MSEKKTTKKRIVIEAMAMGYVPCGLREYTQQVCPRLAELAPDDWELVFLVPRGYRGCFGPRAKYYEVAGSLGVHMLRNYPIMTADLFHPMHQLCRVKRLKLARRTLLTIHDVNFVYTRTGHKYEHSERRFLWRLHRATDLVFISQFARDDVAERFPFHLPWKVIPNGVTPPDLEGMKRPEGVPDGPFLFHLSSLVKYKNPHLLVEMMDSLPDRTLVMAGTNADDELKRMVAQRKNVVLLGALGVAERNWLYSHCEAFLFPSIAEGFGLPPLEAMHCGKPVFLSTLTSLPEVGGDLAFYWPELEPRKMARVLEEKLASPPDPEALKTWARSFSWDTTARSYIEYYKEILRQ